MKKEEISQRKIGFIQGVIYASSLLAEYQMDAEGLLKESGISVSDIRKYADERDLEILEEVLDDL
ncbi:hypothetical protein [Paenibacillus dendritiformis]|uniref:hypothetical protein n=1 Tax=Paenibacillus dendritiformis TaxID=130049 RepID=UPI00387E1798